MGELIVNGLKMALVIAVAAAFLIAITNLLNLIVMIVFDNVIGEVLGIISCCLPFDAAAVFGALGTACAGILSFMVAKKIWALTVTAEDAV